MRGLYFVLPVRKQAMSDDHSQKRPQDTSGIRDLAVQSAESLAERVRKTLGKEIAARL